MGGYSVEQLLGYHSADGSEPSLLLPTSLPRHTTLRSAPDLRPLPEEGQPAGKGEKQVSELPLG